MPPAIAWRWRRGAATSWRAGSPRPASTPTRVAVYAVDVRDVGAIVEAGRSCIAAHGLPDVVIANAGISVGMDTAQAADLEVMRRTYETNNLGMAATFHPFVAAMRERRCGCAGRHRQRRRHSRHARPRRLLLEQGRRDQLLRKPARRAAAVRRQGRDDPARLHRHAADARQSLCDAVPHERRRFRRACPARHRSGTSWRVIPWQMGVVARLLRLLPNSWFDRLLAGRPRKRRQGE